MRRRSAVPRPSASGSAEAVRDSRSALKLRLSTLVSAKKPASASTGCPPVQASAANSAAFTSRSTSESRYRPKALVRPVRRASWPSALSSSVFSWTRSAAASNEPRPSSTAAARPTPPAATTTSGGGTWRRANRRTSGCASGRKTFSHTSSVPRRGLRDRARGLDGKGSLSGPDQLACVVDLVPHVPEQHAARFAVLDVRDDALAVRLLPVLDHLEAGVDLPDRLVAEVEEVGVEERQVVVRSGRAGHVRAHGFAVRVCVILVLDPHRRTECADGEPSDIAGGEDVLVPGYAPVLVDDDSVGGLEPGGFGELGMRDHAQSGDDRVRIERETGLRLDPVARCRCDQLLRAHVDTLLPVVLRHELREAEREEAEADPRLREEHRDAAAVVDETGRDLRADEPAADHDDVRPLGSDLPQAAVVVEGAVPDDAFGAGNLARLRAGGEQELLPLVVLARVVGRGVRREVERDDAVTGDELDALGSLAPDLLLGRTLPQALCQQRSLVRGVRIGADHRDRAFGVVLADALCRHVAGHTGPDDQVFGGLHLSLLSGDTHLGGTH